MWHDAVHGVYACGCVGLCGREKARFLLPVYLLIWLKSDSLTSLVVERDQSTDASLLALRQTEAAQHRQPPPVLESCFFFSVVSIQYSNISSILVVVYSITVR